MRYVDLLSESPPSSAKVSVLGFGCSALMGRSDRRESMSALAMAFDEGITFFDTARSYGYGESERVLGQFLEGRRHEAVICTKFGIMPAAKGGWKRKLKPVAQAAVRYFPSLRTLARRQAAGQNIPGQFSIQTLRESFEMSLRELRTEYVDILLLHAAPREVLDQDDLLEAMGRLVESGKVRAAGISGEEAVISEVFRRCPRLITTAQFSLNCSNLKFSEETFRHSTPNMFLVGNHPYGGPTGVSSTMARIEQLRSTLSLPYELREKLEYNDPQLMPEVILNVILNGTGISAVVPAMMRPESLRSNVQAIRRCRFSSSELDLLRRELIGQS